jgi:AcrR family transcriptional regulator
LAWAAIGLINAGNEAPSCREVAIAAGYSLRTVFNHYGGADDLLRRAAELQVAEFGPLAALVPPSGPAWLRIRVTCHQRRELYEAVGPVLRMAGARAPTAVAIDSLFDDQRLRLRRQLATTFRPEILARGVLAQVTLEALEVTTGWATWNDLRTEGHPADAAERIMAYMVSHFLKG